MIKTFLYFTALASSAEALDLTGPPSAEVPLTERELKCFGRDDGDGATVDYCWRYETGAWCGPGENW